MKLLGQKSIMAESCKDAPTDVSAPPLRGQVNCPAAARPTQGSAWEVFRQHRRQRTLAGQPPTVTTIPTKTYAATIAIGLIWFCPCAVFAQAQDVKLARQHHPWARFEPGAWKKVRVVTETLDEAGNVTSTSTTDTTTLLEFVDADTYSLQLEVTVDVAGKRFQTPPQYIEQGYFGEISAAAAPSSATWR